MGKDRPGTRIVRMANKLGFVVIGKETIAGMTRNLEFWNDIILGGIMSAIGSLTFKFFRSPKAPVGLRIAHPITRFIVQAKIRDAEGRNVTRISFEEWKEHYQGLQRLEYIDDNTAGLTKQFQIYSGDAIPRQVDISTVLTGVSRTSGTAYSLTEGYGTKRRRRILCGLAVYSRTKRIMLRAHPPTCSGREKTGYASLHRGGEDSPKIIPCISASSGKRKRAKDVANPSA